MKILIKNIEVIDKSKLFNHIKGFVTQPMQFLIELKDKDAEDVMEVDELTYNNLKESDAIKFDSDYKDQLEAIEQDNFDMWYRPTIDKEGNIDNKRGLTQAEKWFNSLSTEEKKHVKELSNGVFSNLPMA